MIPPVKELETKIYELTQNKEIFIKEDSRQITIWAAFQNPKLYDIYMHMWLENSYVAIRSYSINYNIRGLGVGSKFYDILEEYIKLCGYKEIHLHQILTGAEKFWIKKGFLIQNRHGVKKI